MGVREGLNRKKLIDGHIASMRAYARELQSWFPFISRKSVILRIKNCASEVEYAHRRIAALERQLDRGY